jgi:hypothetical protein
MPARNVAAALCDHRGAGLLAFRSAMPSAAVPAAAAVATPRRNGRAWTENNDSVPIAALGNQARAGFHQRAFG